jgi:ElaA protein
MIHWTIHPFQELSPVAIHAMYKLRVDVFVVEQTCPYPEVDDADLTALHVLGHDETAEVIAYARILPTGPDGLPHIGRVVVHPDHRGHGLGHRLMQEVLDRIHALSGSSRAALAAQQHLQGFYERHGFVRAGPAYTMDGIAHVDMVRDERDLSVKA